MIEGLKVFYDQSIMAKTRQRIHTWQSKKRSNIRRPTTATTIGIFRAGQKLFQQCQKETKILRRCSSTFPFAIMRHAWNIMDAAAIWNKVHLKDNSSVSYQQKFQGNTLCQSFSCRYRWIVDTISEKRLINYQVKNKKLISLLLLSITSSFSAYPREVNRQGCW